MATRRDKLLDGFPRSGSSLCTKSGPSNGELGLLLFDSRNTLLITFPVATPSARRPSSGIWARRNRSDGFARDLHPDAPGLDFPNTDTQDSRIAAQAYALDSKDPMFDSPIRWLDKAIQNGSTALFPCGGAARPLKRYYLKYI